MSRPTVLIATTQPAMAYALGGKLKEVCRELGLRLEICPDGDKDAALDVPVYAGAEALFEALEKRDPMALADTLVVLDVGTELEDAFQPAAKSGTDWRPSSQRCAGVAVELLLRFPQVFPVFLSPAVPPVSPDGTTTDRVVTPCCPDAGEDRNWPGFHRLRQALCIKNRPKKGTAIVLPLDSLPAFHVPLHFVSPLDGGDGLFSTISRFAHGMRCWFDPTGLRTLVKCRFLGTLFGNATNWENTEEQRKVLLGRIDHVAVAIDEEREFAVLNAYAAYKFGRRAWVITTFTEFNVNPLWVAQAPSVAHDLDVVVLRDIDLRFPDVPDSGVDSSESKRTQLKSVSSPAWKLNNQPRVGENWRVRVVSSNQKIDGGKFWCCAEEWRLGEKGRGNDRQYFGLSKPISTLYELKKLLSRKRFCTRNVASVISKISPADDAATGGHGAPYLNLAMAESLLLQAKRCKDSPTENLVGALLAGEAYELLLCMSKTTALEALLLQHQKEVTAEVEFPGVAQAIDIKSRRGDIEATLDKISEKLPSASMRNMFLSRFWSELRIIYKNVEQFQAAEQANAESLAHSTWLGKFFPDSMLWGNKFAIWVKKLVILPAISFWWWLRWAIGGSAVFTTAYIGLLSIGDNFKQVGQNATDIGWLPYFLKVWHQVILSSLSTSPSKGIIKIEDWLAGDMCGSPDILLYSLTLGHFAYS